MINISFFYLKDYFETQVDHGHSRKCVLECPSSVNQRPVLST